MTDKSKLRSTECILVILFSVQQVNDCGSQGISGGRTFPRVAGDGWLVVKLIRNSLVRYAHSFVSKVLQLVNKNPYGALSMK